MFQSDSYSDSDGLARLTRACEEGERLIWRTDLSPDVLAARVASRLQDRLGSWSSGLEFQVATTSDPWARVWSGRIVAVPDGSMITATVGTRTDVRDITRFGALLLVATLGVLAVCCLTQLEGRELVISLAAVGLAGIVAWGSALASHAWFLGAARGDGDVQLAVALRRILDDAST